MASYFIQSETQYLTSTSTWITLHYPYCTQATLDSQPSLDHATYAASSVSLHLWYSQSRIFFLPNTWIACFFTSFKRSLKFHFLSEAFHRINFHSTWNCKTHKITTITFLTSLSYSFSTVCINFLHTIWFTHLLCVLFVVCLLTRM